MTNPLMTAHTGPVFEMPSDLHLVPDLRRGHVHDYLAPTVLVAERGNSNG
jgi:hypothetical protein